MSDAAALGRIEASAPTARARRAPSGGIPLFRALTKNLVWEFFILAAIVANAAILGYDAHFGDTNRYHALIEQWNMYFLWLFTAELVFEFLAEGPKRYFRRGWNIFDMVVVGLSYIAVNPAISALRTLRVVRVFRLISAVPQMRRVVEALYSAMPGIMATLAILLIVFYIGAVMGTTLFHQEPGFRSLGESALTLFALTQFDSWGETIARLQPRYPYAWFFFLSFTVIAAFAVLNLFIGVIVEAVQHAPREAIKDELDDLENEVEDIAEAQEDAALVQRRLLEEIRALRTEVAHLRQHPPASG
jgi:voltage-gated sodium channel